MRFKASEALRFLGGLAAVGVVLLLLVVRVTSCAPAPAPGDTLAGAPPLPPAPTAPVTPAACLAGTRKEPATMNAGALETLVWAPFGRNEIGWAIYAPMIGREIATACPPHTPAFADALARWQQGQGMPGTGVLTEADFQRMKGVMQMRRPFVQLSARKICPDPTDGTLEPNREGEGYGGKQVFLRPAAFAAYRRMVAEARAAVPEAAADPRFLTIFSGYRSPATDALRCKLEGNCDGIVRAGCSAHRTGLAMDIYVGQAPTFGPDSSADPNRLFMSRTATYRWLVANADRFGFVNYPFEPWHWEWTGEAP